MFASVPTSNLDPSGLFYGLLSTNMDLDDWIMASLLCWLFDVPSKCYRCWWILHHIGHDLPSMAEHTKWRSHVWHKWQFILGQILLHGQKDPNLPHQGFWLDRSSLLDMGRLRVHVHWSDAGYTASQKAWKAMAGNPQWPINQLFCKAPPSQLDLTVCSVVERRRVWFWDWNR